MNIIYDLKLNTVVWTFMDKEVSRLTAGAWSILEVRQDKRLGPRAVRTSAITTATTQCINSNPTYMISFLFSDIICLFLVLLHIINYYQTRI